MRKYLLLALLSCEIGAACASDGLIYLGAGVTNTNANVSSASVPGVGYNPFPDVSSTSWTAFAGVRPISLVGFEIDYFDLGSATNSSSSPHSCVNAGTCSATWHSDAKAVAGNVVAFLPIPVPLLDIYLKAGAARYTLDRNGSTVTGSGSANPGGPTATNYYSYPQTSTVFSWGAGAQVHFGMLGARLEYAGLEKASTGIVSLSVFLKFL